MTEVEESTKCRRFWGGSGWFLDELMTSGAQLELWERRVGG